MLTCFRLSRFNLWFSQTGNVLHLWLKLGLWIKIKFHLQGFLCALFFLQESWQLALKSTSRVRIYLCEMTFASCWRANWLGLLWLNHLNLSLWHSKHPRCLSERLLWSNCWYTQIWARCELCCLKPNRFLSCHLKCRKADRWPKSAIVLLKVTSL